MVGVGGLGALVVLAPVIIRRATDSGADLRVNYLLAAERMFAQAPILGTGPGTWVVQRIGETISPETDYYIPHAHDIYAQTAAELGIVGVLVGIVFVVFLALLVRDAMRDPDLARRTWGWAAAFGLIYFAAHQLLDFYMNMPAVLFAAALPVAWLDATATRPISLRGRSLPALQLGGGLRSGRSTVAGVAGILVLAVACTGLIATELPAGIETTAVEEANAGNWPAALVDARKAAADDPDWAPYQFTLGLAEANAGDPQRAAAAFRTVAQSTDLPEAWVDLAAEELILGDTDAASSALSNAARLGLQRTAIAMAIGDLADRLKEPDLAFRAYAAALTQVPSLAGDPWWQIATVRGRSSGTHSMPRSRRRRPLTAGSSPLMAGDTYRARSLVLLASYVPGTLTPEDVIDAWIGDDAALGRILAICNQHPLDTTALAWAARLEKRRGDTDAADRYLRWAYEASSGAGSAGSELRVSRDPMVGRTVAGGQADFWGTYSYRRPTPWNLLVPSVVQLVLE